MRYRRLGKTGLDISVVGVGGWQFGGTWGRDFTVAEVRRILDRGAELGINLIDTAECYGDHLSESLIGEAVAGNRDHWILATKFGHVPGGSLDPDAYFSAPEVQKQLEASLRALRTDVIDIYQFHSGSDAQFDNDALWTMLEKQVEAGKVRHLGVSIGKPNNAWQAEQAVARGLSVVQVTYNCLQQGAGNTVLPVCRAGDLGVLNRTPLASGFLTGKYLPGARFSDGDVRAMRPAEGRDRDIARANRILEEFASERGNKAAWALAWCLKHSAVTSVIPGAKSLAQLESNVEAVALLPAEERILAASGRVDAPV